jgi:hypothetical protein
MASTPVSRMPRWMHLEHDCVCGEAAYAATEPACDALVKEDEDPRKLSARVQAITDAVVRTHALSLLPVDCSASDEEQLVADVAEFRRRGGLVVAVPPEALEPPSEDKDGDAAGFQCHVRQGDVLIPVDLDGVGASQVLHAALSDVARQSNRFLLSSAGGKDSMKMQHSLAMVGLPYGVLHGYDSKSSGSKLPPPDRRIVEDTVKQTLTQEEACDEALSSAARGHPNRHLESCMRGVFGRGVIPQAGSQWLSELPESFSESPEMIGAQIMDPKSIVPFEVVMSQRAMHEGLSATLFSPRYLVREFLSRHLCPEDARVIFFVCGRASGPLLRRWIESARRHSVLAEDYGMLFRIAVVLLPVTPWMSKMEKSATAKELAPVLDQLYRGLTRVIRAKIPSESGATESLVGDLPGETMWTDVATAALGTE